ncbi:hypothetical protein FNF27_05198 [Cafeteria roenbergensis]|uniref:EF-hand domain-containing protein n=2 Tax=Cafeteria roenbergensis TaxID=33653 RepID=A0A5A8E6D1_CAFRO|nr:hypothetical protein FNF27_05198 [Cafeteria roenbergensis]
MGQALAMCPACTPFCATRCCGCCVVVPQGLQRELVRHRDIFRALGLRHQHLVVLWQTFQSFDQDATGKLLLPEFLAGVGLSDSVIAKRAFDVLDDERTERLCFHEFCRALVVYCTFDKNALSLFSFDVFDFDGDGVLSGPDVQRAILTVYGTNAGSGTTTAKLLDNAKAMAHRYSGGDAAKFSGGKRFALDRRAFDMFVREVPTLCFPVFTVQHRLWERCGGQAFWRSITRERQARAKHTLRSLPGRGSTYEFSNWRDLVAEVGTPTSDQKASLSRLGLVTPKAAAGSQGSAKGRRHSSHRFAGGGPAGGSAGSAGSIGRRASLGAQAALAAGSSTESVLRRARESKVTVASRSRADTGALAGASVGSHADSGKGRVSRADLDFTDVAQGMASLKKHEVATVAVFGSAAERRAAAVAMGTVSREQLEVHRERRRSLAEENLSAIRKLTGQEAYEADDYRRHNQLGARGGKGPGLRRESSKGRRRSVEASARRAAAGGRRRASVGATTVGAMAAAVAAGPSGQRRASVTGGSLGGAVASASVGPAGAGGGRPRARRSSLAVDPSHGRRSAQRSSLAGRSIGGASSNLAHASTPGSMAPGSAFPSGRVGVQSGRRGRRTVTSDNAAGTGISPGRVRRQSLSAPITWGPTATSAPSGAGRTPTSPRVTVVTGTATTAAGSRVAASPMHDVGFF